MGWFIGGGILLVFLIGWAFTWGRVVRTLSSDGHFQEVASKLPALKQAALANHVVAETDAPQAPTESRGLLSSILMGWYKFGSAERPPDDPRVLRTSAGLTAVYALIPEGGKYHHHLWLSLPGAARGAALMGRQMDEVLITLGHLITRLLGVERFSFQPRSRPNAQHLAFTVSPEENEEFAKRAVTALSPEWLKTFRRQMRGSW